jgi:hypothetical protein
MARIASVESLAEALGAQEGRSRAHLEQQALAHQFEQLVQVLGGRRGNQPRDLRAAASFPGWPSFR